MLYNVVIANEVVKEAKRCNKNCLVFKVDYEKAYDLVCWDFLLYMMSQMGFCTKWIRWIQGCLKSASIFILVNGSPRAEFTPQRGLRQGDPLVSFSFNIVAKGLTGLMREAQEKNLFEGFTVGRNNMEIGVLWYVDTTTMKNVRAIKVMSRSFELVSE